MSDDTPPSVVIVGANSYVSVADAEAIVATRLFALPWTTANASTREKALTTATALLDRVRWEGQPVSPTQPLAWPRLPEQCPAGYPLTAEVPPAIVTATVELAIHLIGAGEFSGSPVMLRMLGDSQVMYFAQVADEFPKHIRRLIEPFLRVASANNAEVRF